MKSRLSYFLISGIILSIFIGTFIWRNKHLKEIPSFKDISFTAPISSKYIPIDADLVFHWKINPTILPNYIENYQEKSSKNNTYKTVKSIRDSSFNLISLDFTKDISRISGGYGSFAIEETNKQLLNNWLIILETKKDINVDEELEAISDSDMTDQNISLTKNLNISKPKLYSKKINSNTIIYFLNDDEHILISSNPNIIKSSIDNLERKISSQKEQYKNIHLKDKVNDGIFLLEFSPKKILSFIGQGDDLLGLDKTDKLISSINIVNKQLILEGILGYDIKLKTKIDDLNYDLINIKKESNKFDNSIFIDNPKNYFGEFASHPYQKLIASFVKQSINSDYSNILKFILKYSKGNLIFLKDKNWLVLSRKANIEKKEIDDSLKNENFLNSKLELQDKDLEIWSKITTNNDDEYKLKENIETIIEENEDTYIWSKDLSSIISLDHEKYLPQSRDNDDKQTEKNDFDDAIRIHLGKEKTEIFLNNFYPYILLKTMLGNKLNSPQKIDISFAIPTINYIDFIKYKINLKTS